MFILVCCPCYAIQVLPCINQSHLQTKISDLVQIAPEDFAKRSIIAIEDNINAKYANKVSPSLLAGLQFSRGHIG